MSALSDNAIPSLLPPPSSLKLYHTTSKTLAFIHLLQPYLEMTWNDYVLCLAIKFNKVACGISTLSKPQLALWSNTRKCDFTLSFYNGSALQYLCPEWWVYPIKISLQQTPTEDSTDINVTLYYVVSTAPPCQSLCWSNLLELHELWLAISTIMCPPCIIHALRSFWLSPGENTRGESHPAPTKPKRACLVVGVKK